MTQACNKKGVIILAAGGSGGHLFPAEALAAELARRGFEPHLMTDTRARRFVQCFDENHIHLIQSATITGKNPVRLLRSLWRLLTGFYQARRLLKNLKPQLVIGFGGYPTLPPLYMATRLGITTLIHEQNTVMGRANRFLSRYVQAIAAGFPLSGNPYAAKTTITGNPLRDAVIKARQIPYKQAIVGGKVNLLIFGGSQGASFFSTLMPQALALLDPTQRACLYITQQARADEVAVLNQTYETLRVQADIAPFFDNIAQHIASSHFVIARSGASTVAEIAAIGRPSLFVPYPGALDHDQAENAKRLAATGGVQVIRQQDLSPQKMMEFIMQALDNPDLLTKMAEKLRHNMPDNDHHQATQKLADLVEQLIIVSGCAHKTP